MAADQEQLTVTGRYAGRGVTCPRFELDSGETISLSGVTERDFTAFADQILVLEGSWQNMSYCMQGRDFHVTAIGIKD